MGLGLAREVERERREEKEQEAGADNRREERRESLFPFFPVRRPPPWTLFSFLSLLSRDVFSLFDLFQNVTVFLIKNKQKK